MREYVILPTTQTRRFILMPVSGPILRAVHQLLQAMHHPTAILDMSDIPSLTMRGIERKESLNYLHPVVYMHLRPIVYVRHPNTSRRTPPMTSIVTITTFPEFDSSSQYREMVSSLWTFNGPTHPTTPDTFVLQEEDDKLAHEDLAIGEPIYTSLLRDLVNRNLHLLAI